MLNIHWNQFYYLQSALYPQCPCSWWFCGFWPPIPTPGVEDSESIEGFLNILESKTAWVMQHCSNIASLTRAKTVPSKLQTRLVATMMSNPCSVWWCLKFHHGYHGCIDICIKGTWMMMVLICIDHLQPRVFVNVPSVEARFFRKKCWEFCIFLWGISGLSVSALFCVCGLSMLLQVCAGCAKTKSTVRAASCGPASLDAWPFSESLLLFADTSLSELWPSALIFHATSLFLTFLGLLLIDFLVPPLLASKEAFLFTGAQTTHPAMPGTCEQGNLPSQYLVLCKPPHFDEIA